MATIRKRGNRYQVQVRRSGSEPIARSFTLLKDAKAWARMVELQIDRGDLPEPIRERRNRLEGITLGSLLVRYRDKVTPTKKPSSAENERIFIGAMLRDPMSELPLHKVTTATFTSYRDKLLKAGKAPSSVRRYLAVFSHMFTIAMKEWPDVPVTSNPVLGIRVAGSTDNRRTRRLTEGEEQIIRDEAEKVDNPHVRDAILFALYTGMRRGEILNVRLGDVQASGRLLHIPDTKNGTPRTIPLSGQARAILGPLVASASMPEDRLFPITANALRLAWGRILRRANVSDLRFHDLRHEAISRFFERGLSVPEVAMISGHKDARMLFRYTHPSPLLVGDKLG